jgi:hypothetical protein
VVFYVIKVIHKIMVGQVLTYPLRQAWFMQSISLSDPYASWLIELAEAQGISPEQLLADLVVSAFHAPASLETQQPESLSGVKHQTKG